MEFSNDIFIIQDSNGSLNNLKSPDNIYKIKQGYNLIFLLIIYIISSNGLLETKTT